MARGPDPKGARPQRQPGRALGALLAILGELADGGQQRLREVLDTNHRVRRVQGGDEVQPHLAMVGWPPSTSVSIAAMPLSALRRSVSSPSRAPVAAKVAAYVVVDLQVRVGALRGSFHDDAARSGGWSGRSFPDEG